jgi:DNA polymerase (family 10)
MTNIEIAAVFEDIAGMLREKKDNIFKIRAYEKVARSINELSLPVEQLVSEGRLKEVPGPARRLPKKSPSLSPRAGWAIMKD